MSLTHEEAARALGMPEHEISKVEETRHGTVITTFDKVRTLLTGDEKAPFALYGRPDDRPLDDPEAPPYPIPVFDPNAELEEPKADEADAPKPVKRAAKKAAPPKEPEPADE